MKRIIAIITALALVSTTSGCATIIHGTPQTVTVITTPNGKHVYYQGRKIEDGGTLSVRMRFDSPRFNVGDPSRPIFVEMRYDPDPLLLADAALLLLGVVPGLVALGVDMGTGAWRHLHPTQRVHVPERKETE